IVTNGAPAACRRLIQPGASAGFASPCSTSSTSPSLSAGLTVIRTLTACGNLAHASAGHWDAGPSMYPATISALSGMFSQLTASYMILLIGCASCAARSGLALGRDGEELEADLHLGEAGEIDRSRVG